MVTANLLSLADLSILRALGRGAPERVRRSVRQVCPLCGQDAAAMGADDVRGAAAVHVQDQRVSPGHLPLLKRKVRQPTVCVRRTKRLRGQLGRGKWLQRRQNVKFVLKMI